MWTRRVDLNICEPMANGFRFSEGLALFKDRITTIPEAAEGLKRIARDRLTWLDGQIERQDIPLRQSVHARRHPALLLPRLRQAGRATGEPGAQERRGMVGARRLAAQREGLTRVVGVPDAHHRMPDSSASRDPGSLDGA